MVSASLKTAAPARGLHLEVKNLSHAFDLGKTSLPVLNQVDLSLQPGESVALLGPSGCGKSTLLRLVAGLEAPLSGQILVDGQPIGAPDPSRILVFQDPTLYPWRTVWDNVALGLQARGLIKDQRERVDAVLAKVGLGEFRDAYPRQLSGGMAQRAALARALVNEPRLLLLDEPLGKLDSLTRIAMQGELIRLWQQQRYSSLLVTHDVEEALLLCDRVLVFSNRPARILAELKVDRLYPRHRDDPHLVELRQQALELLGLGSSW
ncbi:ABC transporter ATP-binding protein [Azotobacter beijerinckii]|uniref:NitT/TauT family transport system ATP-binding protein n=1 Tax=Azotobacter beijerinckii TaxID=170623 RepID=A0A1I4DTT1_9GAMM|nr:ABC transporter ATP-binding protein [Azotobacter beijerinckii]SFB39045.1 NitT/TauT family transport system ATP-binding protein [Azotobacter beijerinckii]SFK95657.1 NitT/TauT family transport system ATP-binding protein [Azotobacter beijerinckii]